MYQLLSPTWAMDTVANPHVGVMPGIGGRSVPGVVEHGCTRTGGAWLYPDWWSMANPKANLRLI